MLEGKKMIGRLGCRWVASVVFFLFLQGVALGVAGGAAYQKGKAVEIATFGMGCFWCSEAVFSALAGVERVVPGYSGGTEAHPTYAQVCGGATGHAEVVQITFDPEVVSYAKLLEVFFSMHDPTTVDQQGADVGSQYRSVIFTHSEEQAREARAAIAALDASGLWRDSVVTQVEPFKAFWAAEEYHQNYFNRNPRQGYCMMVVRPKVEKLRKVFSTLLRSEETQHTGRH